MRPDRLFGDTCSAPPVSGFLWFCVKSHIVYRLALVHLAGGRPTLTSWGVSGAVARPRALTSPRWWSARRIFPSPPARPLKRRASDEGGQERPCRRPARASLDAAGDDVNALGLSPFDESGDATRWLASHRAVRPASTPVVGVQTSRPSKKESLLLTIVQAAAALSVGRSTLYEMIAR
jgi:hypothetical protein